MINNDRYMAYQTFHTTNNTAKQLEKQMMSAHQLKSAGMKGNVDPNSFAAKLKQADEYAASGSITVRRILSALCCGRWMNPRRVSRYHEISFIMVRGSLSRRTLCMGIVLLLAAARIRTGSM